MTVYKHKRSPHFTYDFRFKGQRYEGSTGVTSKREAERIEAGIRTQAARDYAMGGAPKAAEPITLDDACGVYLAERLTGKPDFNNAKGKIKLFLAAFGKGTMLHEIGQDDISAYCARRRATVSDSTVNRDLGTLSRIWKHAAKTHKRNVGDPIDWGELRYAEPEERTREAMPSEEVAILDAIRADLRDFIQFAMIRGIRRTGVRRLLWKQLDLSTGMFTYTLKGSAKKKAKQVTKKLTPTEVAIIARQPRVGPFVFTYVCERTRAGKLRADGTREPPRIKGERYPLSDTVIQKAMEAARKDAGITDLRFHDLTRHTAATRLVRTTKNLKLAQLMLDHADIKTTARYVHATEDDLYDAMIAAESRIIPGQAVADDEKKQAG